MRLKKLGAALVVVAALGAVLASGAFAAATTTDVKWYTGASPGTELTGSATATVSQVGPGFFNTTIGEANTPIEFEWLRTECVGCRIENVGGTAIGSGRLKFSEMRVLRPTNCTITPVLETTVLSFTADWMIGTANYIKFVPAAGEETQFFVYKLEGTTCALKTTVAAKGSFFLNSENPTGTQAASQRVFSSAAINSTAGGNFHVGEKAASLTETADFSIGGTAFGTH